MKNRYENRLWKVLEKEKLTDLSQFHELGRFDEVPLISRTSEVDFLPQKEGVANEILLRFALKYLKAVIAYEEHPTGYFAAITLWEPASDILVPHLFFWCASAKELKEKLTLDSVSGALGKKVNKLTSSFHLGERFEVREESGTSPDAKRYFIAPEVAPYRGFVTMRVLSKRVKAAR